MRHREPIGRRAFVTGALGVGGAAPLVARNQGGELSARGVAPSDAWSGEPALMHVMPAHFVGFKPAKAYHYGSVRTLAVIYRTDREILGSFLPPGFVPGQDPTVTVYFQSCRDVDFLAGRGYNLMGVNFAASFRGRRDLLDGDFAAVMWENDTNAIVAGREQTGIPKTFADLPDPTESEGSWTFGCSLWGMPLVKGHITGLRPVSAEMVTAIEQRTNQAAWMGWKYIPKADGSGPDVSYPTVVPKAARFARGWFGSGSVEFFEPSGGGLVAEMTRSVLSALRKLPVVASVSAAVFEGSQDLMLHDSRRLE